MSDFDSTDFDSSSADAPQTQQKQPARHEPKYGTFEYPPFIYLTACRSLFQQQEFSYREKQINLLVRDKNASTQEDIIERFYQTYGDYNIVEKAVYAPFSEPRDGSALLLLALEPYRRAKPAQNCVKRVRTKTGLVVELSRPDYVYKAVKQAEFTRYAGAFTLSDSAQTVLTCKHGSLTFTFEQQVSVVDFAVMPQDYLAICGDAGYVVIVDLPSFKFKYAQNCARRLSSVCSLNGQVLVLAVDGSVRRITDLSVEMLGQDKSYLELGTFKNKGYIRTTQGTFLTFDSAEQVRSADFSVSYFLEPDEQ